MDLKKLLKENAPANIAAELEFDGAIMVRLAYWPQSKLQKVVKDTRRIKFKRHQKQEVFDNDAFKEQIATAILDWRDLTPRALARAGLINIAGMEPEEKEKPIEYSPEGALELVNGFPAFAEWVLDNCTDPDNYDLEGESKNLPSTPGTPTGPGGSTATSAKEATKN